MTWDMKYTGLIVRLMRMAQTTPRTTPSSVVIIHSTIPKVPRKYRNTNAPMKANARVGETTMRSHVIQ